MSISSLPAVMLINIYEYLHEKSAITLGLTCNKLYQIQESEHLWKFFCIGHLFP